MSTMSLWPRRFAILTVGFFVAFGLLIQGALPASACSCMMPDPVKGLAEADGAFVGALMVKEEQTGGMVNGGELIDYVFEVEAALKGDIGEVVTVKSAADGAACGYEIPVGSRAGFTLYRSAAGWEGNLCATYDADALLAAAEDLPEPVTTTTAGEPVEAAPPTSVPIESDGVSPWVFAAGAGVVVGVLAVMLTRARRPSDQDGG
jgi:hypothetical protein